MVISASAAQDEYSSLSRKASVGVHGYVLVYSVCSQSSFAKLGLIRDRLLSVVGSSQVPMVLVGNKMDSASERCAARHWRAVNPW